MIILAGKIISDDILRHLEATQRPILDNEYARTRGKNFKLNLIPSEEAASRIRAGERLYTTNEDALSWVYENLADTDLVRQIDLMKNKAKLRDLTRELYPNFYYRDCTFDELKGLDENNLPYPLILKLTVGFGSVGVYTLFNCEDFKNAINDIVLHKEAWHRAYDQNVVGSRFLLEQMINRPEYAVDVYFKDDGTPIILNIFEHRFADERDVSDRLYCCGAKLLKEELSRFTDFFKRINEKMNLRNFPLHAEVRVWGDDLIPIEFNPLRFAGLTTTDTAFYAYGFHSLDAFLDDITPNWDNILKGKEDKIYSFILIDKGGKDTPSSTFDYDSLCKRFRKVCSLRKIDEPVPKLFAILIAETLEENQEELKNILTAQF